MTAPIAPAAITAAGAPGQPWPLPIDDVEDLLDQDETWIGRDGTVYQLDELPYSRLSAVQRWLELKAPEIQTTIMDSAWREVRATPAFMRCGPAEDAALAQWDEEAGWPEGWWIAEQPLYQRIGELLGDRRFEPGVCRDCRGGGLIPAWAGEMQTCLGCYRPPVNLRHFERDLRRIREGAR